MSDETTFDLLAEVVSHTQYRPGWRIALALDAHPQGRHRDEALMSQLTMADKPFLVNVVIAELEER